VETTRGDHDAELALLRGTEGLLTDGLILIAITLRPSDEAEARAGYPIVLIGDRELGGPTDYVGLANRTASRAAVEHLIATGRRRIALLGTMPDGFDTFDVRHAGYLDALDAHGLTADPALAIPTAWNRDGAEAAMERFLATGAPLPDGIFAMNDSAAFGAIRALQRQGFAVPGDVSVVGFDDVVESRYSSPTLTSISPSPDEIAATSLELLADRIASPGRAPIHRHAGFSLVVRESSTL
jgi:DNA-binding LacI/PurR family transcriptional regulator